MGKQIVILGLIMLAAVGMAAAADPAIPSALPPTSGEDQGGDHVIGSITGGPATDAAPVGGPVPENAFPNLPAAPSPASGAAVVEVTTVAGAIAAVGVVGSFFF